jgi:hypothetical protein
MGNTRLAKQLGLGHSQAVRMANEFKQSLQGVGSYFEVRRQLVRSYAVV